MSLCYTRELTFITYENNGYIKWIDQVMRDKHESLFSSPWEFCMRLSWFDSSEIHVLVLKFYSILNNIDQKIHWSLYDRFNDHHRIVHEDPDHFYILKIFKKKSVRQRNEIIPFNELFFVQFFTFMNTKCIKYAQSKIICVIVIFLFSFTCNR